MPQVREQLGILAANAGMVEAMLAGMHRATGGAGDPRADRRARNARRSDITASSPEGPDLLLAAI
jgi:hypothetical protein